MKKRNILLLLFMSLALWSMGAMTDQQVIAYIKQQVAAGKTQQQIGQELLSKGVTIEQIQRIKALYDSQDTNSSSTLNTVATSRMRSNAQNQKATNKNAKGAENQIGAELSEGNNDFNILGGSLDEMLLLNEEEPMDTVPEVRIFGHDIFNTNNSVFEPLTNIGTPQNYRLGPGDEVIIDIWGSNEEHFRDIISPEGSIMIEQLGPVFLNGLTIQEANNHIKNSFSRKYAGMAEEETEVQLTLGEVRTILVNVLGEVETPGSFVISPFSSVLNALYLAGGVNDLGTLRNIQVLRNGRLIATVDVYDYLLKGKTAGNITLQEGDVVIVPPYEQLINVTGNVKRPMLYEMIPSETVATLLNYAGGFAGDAYTGMVRLERHAGLEKELFNIESPDFNVYHLQDGDIVTVGTVLDRYANKVELDGAVLRPGMYAIGQNVTTVSELIAAAEGLKEDAYTGRVLLYREGPELQLQVLSFDLGEIMSGVAPDIELKKNDVLVVSSIDEIIDRGYITIQGQVNFPGDYPYAENYTLEDVILAAGGLLEGASTARVDIARRIVDPAATEQILQTAKLYTVSIDKSLKIGTGVNFKLEPFDMIQVRMSPGYEVQQTVSIEGEVLFAGEYVLEKRNERLSDMVKRAGGVLDEAYVKGAYLERKLTEAEYQARQEVMKLATQNQNQKDSIALSKIEVADTYNVGIDLEKALKNPGTHYDLVLQEGDRLFIPQIQSTVKISGDVMFPNAVLYEPGKNLNYYINQAGGYGERAKKNKAFIVYMNGTVTRAKRNSEIEPGCQIIVPSKSANSGANWGQIMAIASSFTSVAALAATITNIFK